MEKNNPKLIAGIVIFLGVFCIGAGLYAALRSDDTQNTNTAPQVVYVTKTPESAQTVAPAKPKNSLIENGAYKYEGNPRVYIHKGGTLYVVASENAFLRHYGCGRVNDLSECAPIYVMPAWVTSKMISSEWIR